MLLGFKTRLWRDTLLGFMLGTAVALLAGCDNGGAAAKAGVEADDQPAGQPAAGGTSDDGDELAELEPLPVPDGTPEELFAFMDETTERELPELSGEVTSDEETEPSADAPSGDDYGLRLIRLMKSRIVACDKIIGGDPPAESKTRAIRIRLDAMRTLAALRPEEYSREFEAYTDRIVKGNDPFLRRMANSIMFQASVNRYISQAASKPDEIFQSLEALLSDKQAGPEVFTAVRDATGWIFQNGDIETATQLYRRLGDHFSNHEDEVLAAEATNLQSQAIELGLKQLIFRISEDKAKPGELVDRVKQLIAPENLDEPILAYAMQTASFFENNGYYDEARQTYDMIYDRFAEDADEETALAVQHSIDFARRRLGLLDSKIRLDGVRLNGEPFKWESYRGEWVVVCFWTSWHREWTAEADSIRSAVASMGDKNISVVSINMDDDRNALERYLQENSAYWPIVVSPDPATPGFENENAVRCGVEAVPFVLLVDPDGKVTDIHLLGDRLPAALQKRIE